MTDDEIKLIVDRLTVNTIEENAFEVKKVLYNHDSDDAELDELLLDFVNAHSNETQLDSKLQENSKTKLIEWLRQKSKNETIIALAKCLGAGACVYLAYFWILCK